MYPDVIVDEFAEAANRGLVPLPRRNQFRETLSELKEAARAEPALRPGSAHLGW